MAKENVNGMKNPKKHDYVKGPTIEVCNLCGLQEHAHAEFPPCVGSNPNDFEPKSEDILEVKSVQLLPSKEIFISKDKVIQEIEKKISNPKLETCFCSSKCENSTEALQDLLNTIKKT